MCNFKTSAILTLQTLVLAISMVLESTALPLALPILKVVGASVAGLGLAVPLGAVALLRRVSSSVGLASPTKSMLAEENPKSECALFRHLPDLAENLAWRSLGAMKTTPIHQCRIPSSSEGGVGKSPRHIFYIP
jgi:hypothetical protein